MRYILIAFQNAFYMDESGIVYVNGTLDYQQASFFFYTVLVRDIAAPNIQTGQGQVIIEVQPFNVKDPELPGLPKNITIEENRLPKSFVNTIVATDEDGIDQFSIFEQPIPYFDVSQNGMYS